MPRTLGDRSVSAIYSDRVLELAAGSPIFASGEGIGTLATTDSRDMAGRECRYR
jgi:hypothetical protein